MSLIGISVDIIICGYFSGNACENVYCNNCKDFFEALIVVMPVKYQFLWSTYSKTQANLNTHTCMNTTFVAIYIVMIIICVAMFAAI